MHSNKNTVRRIQRSTRFSVLRRFIGSDSGVNLFSERAGRIILLLRECYKSPSVQKPPPQEGTHCAVRRGNEAIPTRRRRASCNTPGYAVRLSSLFQIRTLPTFLFGVALRRIYQITTSHLVRTACIPQDVQRLLLEPPLQHAPPFNRNRRLPLTRVRDPDNRVLLRAIFHPSPSPSPSFSSSGGVAAWFGRL